jgi:hypothetical protein
MKLAVLTLAVLLPSSTALGHSEHGALVVVATPAGSGTTTVETKAAGGGGTLARRELGGRYRVPYAAPGDRLGGLSSDQGSVLLERLDEPERASEFRLLRTSGNGAGRRIALKGRWSFDAISPNGRLVYLIQHDIGGDPAHYAVRVYNVAKGRVQAGRVVDKRESDEQMGGEPIWRLNGPGDRWAYTLYERPAAPPFIHALDTTIGMAVCIDLPKTLTTRPDVRALRLTMAGEDRLRLLDRSGAELARIAVDQTFHSYDDYRVLSSL